MSSASNESSRLISAYTTATVSVQNAGSKGKGAATDFSELDDAFTAFRNRVNASVKARDDLTDSKSKSRGTPTAETRKLNLIDCDISELKNTSTAGSLKSMLHRGSSSSKNESKQEKFSQLVKDLEALRMEIDADAVLLRGAQGLRPEKGEIESEPEITLEMLDPEWKE